MLHDVVAVGLPKDAPKFEASVEGLMSRPHASLHREILGGVAGVVRTFYLVRVTNVPVVDFDPLSWLEKSELVHEDLDVRPGAGGVGSPDPDQIPRENIDAELISQGGFARIFVGAEGVPLLCGPLLLDLEVRPVDRHQAVVAYVMGVQPALKDDLAGGGGGRVRRRRSKEHDNKPHLPRRLPAHRCAL